MLGPKPAASARRRVLLAVSARTQRRIAAILSDCELSFVPSGSRLLQALEHADHDLVIIGAHFDESSALAVLEQLGKRRDVPPLVCVRGASRFGRPSVEALRLASEQLGARGFIDLEQYPDNEAGNARVRRMLERLFAR
jgi:hypothetical protein